MIKFFLTPKWFSGIDILIDSFVIIVCLLISFYSCRIYRLTKERKQKFFSFAFLMIALSFVFKIITNLNIYFELVREKVVGFLKTGMIYLSLDPDFFYRTAFFFYMLLMLIALYLIFLISQRVVKQKKEIDFKEIVLILYLLLIISVFSNYKYFVFYLSTAFWFSLISYNYYLNYKNKKTKTAFFVFLGFPILALSQFIFIFNFISPKLYVAGEIIQLFGFLALLVGYLLIFKR